MKNFIIYSGIALVVCVKMYNTSFNQKSEIGTSQESKKEIVVDKSATTLLANTSVTNSKKVMKTRQKTDLKSRTSAIRNFSKVPNNTTFGKDEPIEAVSTNKMNKTADELITEDNLITENNISNETQALDFDIINNSIVGFKVVDYVKPFKIEKTANELIAEDNLITENNISNETQFLNFDIINSNTVVFEIVEFVNTSKIEKTANELIAEDNLITENKISNKTQILNFEIINKISKP